MAEETKTEQWHFPSVVHLRLRDQSLLKFAPGVRNVPSDLGDAEKKLLRIYGASPVQEQPKQATSAPKTPVAASVKPEGTSDKATKSEGSSETSQKPKEVSK